MIPFLVGAAASLLPAIVSSLIGSKNERQAREEAAPQYDAMVTQLVGRGMPRSQAQEHADEQIKGAVQEKMGEGAIPPWLELALSIPAGLAGGALAGAAMKGVAKGGLKAALGMGAKAEAGAVGKAATAEAQGAAAVEKAANTATKGVPDAFLSKGELPSIPDLKEDPGILTPFGPKPAPRTMTPPSEDFMEHSMPDKRGRFDSIAPEFNELAAEEAPLVHELAQSRISTPVGPRVSNYPERTAIDAALRKRRLESELVKPFHMNTTQGGVEIEL